MSDVLSQSEIDSLLSALSTGEFDVNDTAEVSVKTVKDYDFARPSKFSKEHLRTLEIIFEHYGRLYHRGSIYTHSYLNRACRGLVQHFRIQYR